MKRIVALAAGVVFSLVLHAQAWAGLTVNGNGTVTDTVTSLVWQQQDDGQPRTWEAALAYCEGLTLAGQGDWRLPDRFELQSLVDYTIPSPGPTIDTTVFPGTKSSWYWSSTTDADYSSFAWYVDFYNGVVYSNGKTSLRYVRCVRSGPVTGSFDPLSISALAPADGVKKGGTTVTVSGQGFGASQGGVTVGGLTAVVSSWAATSITLTTPAHAAGAVDVVVTLADGKTVVTKTAGFTYLNAIPSATGKAITTNEDTAATGTVTATDSDGDALTFTKATNPSHGTATVNPDGAFTYTPAANYFGSDAFTVTASDGGTSSAPAIVSITVQPVNDPPLASSGTLSTSEDAAKSGTLNGSDPDGDTMTFTIDSQPSHGSISLTNAATGAYTYTPTANYHGSDAFTFTVGDGTATTSPAQVSVTVTSVNDLPSATGKAITAYQGFPQTGTVTATDADSDPLTFSLATNPSHGTATVNPDGTFTYTPAANYAGSDAFTFTAGDGAATSAPATVAITVLSDPDVDKDGIVNESDPDDDNDGLSDLEESLIGSNPYHPDTDGDGLADAVDPAPLTNHFTVEPEPVEAITSQDEPFSLSLATLYLDSVDPASDRWYRLTVGAAGAGIHHLLVKPVDLAEKTSGAGRLICTVYALQGDGQAVKVRTSELAAASLQAFRLPLASGDYLVQVAAKELYYDDFQLIALKSGRLYDMTVTVNEQGTVSQPLVIPAAASYRLYARVEGGTLDGTKTATLGLYGGKLTGTPQPAKLIAELGTAEEFSTSVNLKPGLVTLAASGTAGETVRFWLDQAGPAPAGVELEPNQTITDADSLATAGSAPAATMSRSGVLASPGDSDTFGFLVGSSDDQAKHTLTITTTLTPATKPAGSSQSLTLLSASGSQLKPRVIGSAKTSDTFTAIYPAGLYYLKFADLADDSVASTGVAYTLTVSDAAGAITPLVKEEANAQVGQQYGSLLAAILLQEEWNENGGAATAVTDPYGEAIIVAGIGDAPTDSLYNATQALADHFYTVASLRGLSDEAIYYLNANPTHDIDGDGLPDAVVDESAPTTAKVAEAIAWAGERQGTGPLYLYLVDHGGKQQFLISEKQKQILTAAMLNQALDAFQAKTKRPVVVIIEACYSGSFVAPLTAGGAANRAVFTSTNVGEVAMIEPGGSVSFSRFLLNELKKGKGLGSAFEQAKAILKGNGYAEVYKNQHPQGAAAGLDLQKLGPPYILADGYETAAVASKFVATVGAKDGVVINQAVPQATLAATIFSVSGIKRVWATVLPPGYVPPEAGADFVTPNLSGMTVELKYDNTAGKYQAVFTPPSPLVTGTYTVTYFLEDLDGEIVSTAASQAGVGLKFSVLSGWNLLGARMPIPLGDEFSDGTTITSLWKWKGEGEDGGWAVRLPADADKGAAYAKGKGFTLLTAIEPGDGFWVNSKQPVEVTPGATPAADAPLSLVKGWNLVGLKGGAVQGAALLLAGKGASVESLWKWENGGWSVRLPGNEDGGQAYAKDKGFSLLNSINPGEGFWVNALEFTTMP